MRTMRGMSFIDAIVGSALVLIVFMTLFGLIRASILITGTAKAKAGAAAVANAQMEYIRSLDYDSIGTVGGIPSGLIAQNSTTTLNGISYGVRTFIQYEDDPADGSGGSDSNGITTDYKDIKVTVYYSVQNTTRTENLVSVVAPKSIETTTNGGTLAINVVDASGAAVPGAAVRITNSSISPTVDLTTYADSSGVVYLGGAATSTEYQISVTSNGYSTAQTYARDATNQNPTPGYLTVVKNVTTTSTFAIDRLATLTIRTFAPAASASFTDTFANSSKLTTLSSTTASGGVLTLTGSIGSYPSSGYALSTTTSPASLERWTSVTATINTPTGTEVLVHVTDAAGALIPDAALPGNAAGFSTFPIDLTALATTSYASLRLSADLSSSDPDAAPEIDSWSLTYDAGPLPIPDVSFTLTGAKTVGTTGGGAPIFKTTVSTTTDSSGTRTMSLEWDLYNITLPSYTVDSSNPADPYQLLPNDTLDVSLTIH